MVKKVLLTVLLAGLVLPMAACGGGKNKTYVNTEEKISMDYPAEWLEVSADEIKNQIDPTGATIAAFRDIANQEDNFVPNVNIVKEDLSADLTSDNYAAISITNTAKQMEAYEKLNVYSTKIAGQRTKIHIFKAKANASAQKNKYIQTYLVNNKKGYVITAAMPENFDKNKSNVYEGAVKKIRFNK